MIDRIGYLGKIDNKFKVWFNGDQYYAQFNGMNFCIDYENIPESRKQRLSYDN